jgi:hypothetical protein
LKIGVCVVPVQSRVDTTVASELIMTITVGQVGSFAVADIFFSPLMQTPELG